MKTIHSKKTFSIMSKTNNATFESIHDAIKSVMDDGECALFTWISGICDTRRKKKLFRGMNIIHVEDGRVRYDTTSFREIEKNKKLAGCVHVIVKVTKSDQCPCPNCDNGEKRYYLFHWGHNCVERLESSTCRTYVKLYLKQNLDEDPLASYF